MAKDTNKFKRRALTDEVRHTALAGQTGTLQSAEAKEKLASKGESLPEPAAPAAAATPAPTVAPPAVEPTPVAAETSVATAATAPAPPAVEPTDTSADTEVLTAPARPRRGRGTAAPSPAASAPARVQGYTVALPQAYGPVLRTATILVEGKRARDTGEPSQKVTVGELVQMAVDKLLATLRKQGLQIPEVEK
jgi:hypothetical protein